MDTWASLEPATYPIAILSIVLLIITFLLFRKGSPFSSRKPLTLVLLVGDYIKSLKRQRACDETFQSDDTFEDFHQVVHVPSLNRETVERLLVSHPSVTHLTLSASRLTVLTASTSLFKIGDLLDGWKASLVSLKLLLHFTHLHCTASRRQSASPGTCDLLGVINQKLTRLEHLTLSSNIRLLPHNAFALSILGRLRSFTLDTKDAVSSLTRSFTRYAALNDALASIQLNNPLDWEYTYPAFTGPLWSKFTHLNVERWEIEPRVRLAELPLISLFPSLLNLKFLSLGAQFLCRSRYSRLMATLAVLRALTTLELQITSENHLTLQEEAVDPPEVLPELPNIKRLFLSITSVDHGDNQVALFYIDAIYPRLDLLSVHFDAQSCDHPACRYGPEYADDYGREPPVPADIMQHCAAHLYEQVSLVGVGRKEVTFQWTVPGNLWTAAQLALQE